MAKDLRHFIKALQEKAPEELITVEKEIDPRFEASAVLQHLENRDAFPAVLFNKSKNLRGESSPFRLMSNLHATRQKCAIALDLEKHEWRSELVEEYSRRQRNRIKPIIVSREEAPVKQVIRTGKDIDLFELPAMAIHAMDGQAYLNDVVIAADPDTGVYNSSHHRMKIKSKTRTGLYASPRHLWSYFRRAEERGEPLPIAMVHGHHPAIHLAAESIVPIEDDEYEVTSGLLNEPIRLVPSEAFGDRLMVPADAEVVIEAEILPNVREAEGPYGEFTGYYGPSRYAWVCEVKAITYRKDPIWVQMFVGHADCSIVGGIGKEAGTLDIIKATAVPTVKAIHFPISGCCRFISYISIAQKAEGEARVAALASFPPFDELKIVVVVDEDIDVFNERQVLWAVATRVQPDDGLDIIRHVRGGTLDPSQVRLTDGSKLIIDATKPQDRPFAKTLDIPADVMGRIRLEDLLSPADRARIGI
ncbi:MAG: UbiD family decarboxylase [Firmicutes bacterium]|nr:UbiD family decarboxylase [Bacillota bacterium]